MPNVWPSFDWSSMFRYFNRTAILPFLEQKLKLNIEIICVNGWLDAWLFLWLFIVFPLSLCVCAWPSGGIYILIKNFYNYINSSRREDMPFVYLIFWVEAVKCIELPVCRLFFC